MASSRAVVVALAATLVAAAFAPSAAEARRPRPSKDRGEVVLDGAVVPVRWIDGDTFALEGGPRRGKHARLEGVNTLETFGPVHRWGRWRPEELLAIARSSAAVVASGRWVCTAAGDADRYGRLLVACPDAARRLVEAGHALVLAVDGPVDPALVAAQRVAQRAGAGIWAKGVPPVIPTSLHSAEERGLGRRGAYDRLVDTRTGASDARSHERAYATCEEVCAGPDHDRACMTYVPFERRYRGRPECLQAR
jgi:endonuclease YncB( thermonuclease family)